MNSDKSVFNNDDIKNQKLYHDLYSAHGQNIKTLNWGSKDSQQKRFEILNGIANLQNQTVLDVGCGFADFYEFLMNKGLSVLYTGLDITQPIIIETAKRFPQIGIISDSLLNLDSSNKFDYVFASGIYTYRTEKEYEFLEAMTKKMFEICIKGVAFNSLSIWTENKDLGEFYADPLVVMNICKNLSKKIILRHDYHPNDFTIYIYK